MQSSYGPDHACVADIRGSLFDYLQSQWVQAVQWNLCKTEQPFTAQFGFIFLSEVFEHLQLSSHVVLERLRRAAAYQRSTRRSQPANRVEM